MQEIFREHRELEVETGRYKKFDFIAFKPDYAMVVFWLFTSPEGVKGGAEVCSGDNPANCTRKAIEVANKLFPAESE